MFTFRGIVTLLSAAHVAAFVPFGVVPGSVPHQVQTPPAVQQVQPAQSTEPLAFGGGTLIADLGKAASEAVKGKVADDIKTVASDVKVPEDKLGKRAASAVKNAASGVDVPNPAGGIGSAKEAVGGGSAGGKRKVSGKDVTNPSDAAADTVKELDKKTDKNFIPK